MRMHTQTNRQTGIMILGGWIILHVSSPVYARHAVFHIVPEKAEAVLHTEINKNGAMQTPSNGEHVMWEFNSV